MMSKNTKQNVLVVFGADWCPNCVNLKNDLNKYPPSNMIIVLVDVEKNSNLAKEYGVIRIPDYLILENGIETDRKRGYKSRVEFKKWIKNYEQ